MNPNAVKGRLSSLPFTAFALSFKCLERCLACLLERLPCGCRLPILPVASSLNRAANEGIDLLQFSVKKKTMQKRFSFELRHSSRSTRDHRQRKSHDAKRILRHQWR